MQIYQSSNKEQFLCEVAEFACKNFSDDFAKLKIILPSGLLCSQLQRTFVQKLQTSIIPTVIPLGELDVGNEEIFNIPSTKIGSISKLEEKITLAETIHSYSKLSYNLSQSLRLAPTLANLFFEFEANNINLSALKNLPILDQPQHWHTIYDFLCYASENWLNKINSLHKMTRAAYQKLIFETEIRRLKNNKQHFLLLAGITGDNYITYEFIKNVTKLDNVHMILPPHADIQQQSKFSPEEALYRIQQLIQLLEVEKTQIIKLGKIKPSIIDKLIINSSSNILSQTINYVEFENIFHEAEYIALKCEESQGNKIAIIAHNQQTKEQYCTFLDKYGLNYHDLFGVDILKHPVISMLLLLSTHLCYEFNVKSFFTLISHPLINSKYIQELKNLIRKHNRFVANLDDISAIVEQYASSGLKEYYLSLYKLLSTQPSKNRFDSILKYMIKSIEGLIDNIWQLYPNISMSLSELIQVDWHPKLNNLEDFPEILRQILEGGRISDTNSNANITICRSHDAALINYDLIIITDLNEGNYPISSFNNPWLNKQMQKELKLDGYMANLGSTLYDFYLNMQNKNILLTRAKSQTSNKQMLPSPFLLNLKHILGDRLKTVFAIPSKQNIDPSVVNPYAQSKIFPGQISATDIELLIRAPYNFYAKKILNLRPINEIDEQPNLAEFGNFFHLVAEEYTKNYIKHQADKILTITEIAKSILTSSNLPEQTKKSWNVKFSTLAQEFIEFDEDRRKNAIHIYSEIKGKMKLNIAGCDINITAIADRIEIGKNNIATIMDYKTGAIPSKKDILSGMSPQLLVEAIILSEGGFSTESSRVDRITYIKINSSSPYISTTEIDITPEDLASHKQGLISLLEHYSKTMNFVVEPNFMKYDDYSHLARRL